ncbi:hypothetical protein TNCT_704321 [Trichonephila clavata]|uniref:Uncharacterized protein n=1 Tax=Trichonephila clavata TaxID=2740835 RepID=A0A8X6KH49_TRICU|nr:hypothetical protein TNCT_704321 [Trichonephila clavata]
MDKYFKSFINNIVGNDSTPSKDLFQQDSTSTQSIENNEACSTNAGAETSNSESSMTCPDGESEPRKKKDRQSDFSSKIDEYLKITSAKRRQNKQNSFLNEVAGVKEMSTRRRSSSRNKQMDLSENQRRSSSRSRKGSNSRRSTSRKRKSSKRRKKSRSGSRRRRSRGSRSRSKSRSKSRRRSSSKRRSRRSRSRKPKGQSAPSPDDPSGSNTPEPSLNEENTELLF